MSHGNDSSSKGGENIQKKNKTDYRIIIARIAEIRIIMIEILQLVNLDGLLLSVLRHLKLKQDTLNVYLCIDYTDFFYLLNVMR